MSILLVLAFLLGNFYKFSFLSLDVHVSVLDIVVTLLTLVAVIKNYPQINLKAVKSPLGWFLLIALLSLIPALFHFGLVPVVVGAMYLVRFAVYSCQPWVIKKLFTSNQITKLILVLGLTLVVTGLIQYCLFPDIRSLQVADWDGHYYRVVGTLLDPGFIGIMLVMFLIFLSEFRNNGYKILWMVTYPAFVFTYSRSSYLAYLVAMAYIAYRRKSWKFLLITWVLLGITIPLLPRASSGEGVKLERTSSIQARIDNWRNSLIITKDHPYLGVGFNTYRYAQKDYGFISANRWLNSHAGAGADSSLLFVAATTGLVGLTIYLYYLSSLWKSRLARPFLLALLVHSLFLNSLFYPFVLVFFALVMDYKSPSALSGSDSPPRRSQ